jgi:hypothetical protein
MKHILSIISISNFPRTQYMQHYSFSPESKLSHPGEKKYFMDLSTTNINIAELSIQKIIEKDLANKERWEM